MRKRICNIVCDITGGGVESVLINYFSHMNLNNCDLDLITYGISSESCAEKFRDLGFNIILIPPKRNGFFRSVKEMNKIFRIQKYDIIHAHLTEWNCIPMFLGWINGVHTRISHSHMAGYCNGLKQKIIFSMQKLINCMFANKYCACGEDAAKYLYGTKRYKKGNIHILNNAIDIDKFRRNDTIRKVVRTELHIDESTLCVGHIGRFLEQKNHTFLIDIFAELVKIYPDSCLLLMGTGELEVPIHKKVCKKGLEDKIQFLGVRNDPERIYQAMDVFCLPSLFEGLPVVGIEVQAADIPCVMSDTISQKVKLTPLINMESLNESAKTWANKLLNVAKAEKAQRNFPDEYNILKVCNRWKKLYEE